MNELKSKYVSEDQGEIGNGYRFFIFNIILEVKNYKKTIGRGFECNRSFL